MSVVGRRIRIQGTVQGVGFRPWVYRLARQAGVSGSVRNDSSGVTIEAFGPPTAVDDLLARLRVEPPAAAEIRSLEWEELDADPPAGFSIVPSDRSRERTVSIPPDLATCGECVTEILDPGDRRHRYPFTNCTNCGPRFTIVLDIPYDRPATTMAAFTMCPRCRQEYGTPEDRRFHAQPNACPQCGPRLELLDASGQVISASDAALLQAAERLRRGEILALKGLGGFQLLVDARNGRAVGRLRRRKARHEKPLALMVSDLAAARRLCKVPAAASGLLEAPQGSIVLLSRLPKAEVAAEVAPGNPCLGLMLPYTPLHHLLLRELGFPVVATSGNLSDEPICIDNREALERLGEIADCFLVHDRPIARHADDSVAMVLDGGPVLLRRARGYAPAPIALGRMAPTVLAVGAHLKNTVAVNLGRNVFISQHIGDMETPEAHDAFERVIGDLLRMCEAEPVAVVHDLHPDYLSTRWARIAVEQSAAPHRPATSRPPALTGARLLPVQHHHAHLASCLADNGIDGPALGVTWDGTGLGTDGTIWGGEFLLGDARFYARVARLRPFRLPGGEAAIREPRRCALAVLWELGGETLLEGVADLAPLRSLTSKERRLMTRMLATGLRAPLTSSAGRLFDAVAALLDLHQVTSFEGQAAMALEFAAVAPSDGYRLDLLPMPADGPLDEESAERRPPGGRMLELDWRPTIEAILDDLRSGVGAGEIAGRFHHALASAIVAVAREVGEPRVALTGGCFQNRLLTELTAAGLRAAGFEVMSHRKVPPNDGGISLGQVAIAAAWLAPDG